MPKNQRSPKSRLILPELPGLHDVTKQDYKKARETLGDAFREDPIWARILEGALEKFPYAFGTPLKMALHYGRAYAPSTDVRAIAGWLSSPNVDMTIWRVIRSGAIWPSMKLGMKYGKLTMQVFEKITRDRQEYMRDKEPYAYLLVIGVDPAYHRQGLGSLLVRSMLENLPPDTPAYLETETEGNVRFYEKLGFEVVKEITVPVLELPMWEMLHPGG